MRVEPVYTPVSRSQAEAVDAATDDDALLASENADPGSSTDGGEADDEVGPSGCFPGLGAAGHSTDTFESDLGATVPTQMKICWFKQPVSHVSFPVLFSAYAWWTCALEFVFFALRRSVKNIDFQ